MAYEALNQIGSEKRNLIVIYNDNNMSISQNVGAVSQAFAKMRSSSPYATFKDDVKQILNTSSVGSSIYTGMKIVKDTVKRSVVDSSIFGELGLEYLGPVDGHNIRALIKILNVAKKHQGPVVVHVITQKGKGYELSENDTDGHWHGVSSFDPDTGNNFSQLPAGHFSWSQVISETLVRLAKSNPKIWRSHRQ